jgi:Asp-tRNA(Asn)/Glu-tRNA(Gln) amidotransferase A subunit family amidase
VEYVRYDALGLANLIARKEIAAAELLAAVRERVEAINPRINAFCHFFFEQAEAQLAEGLPPGLLSGVPFALKDLGQQLRGTPTTSGSRVWMNTRASFDSTLVERYRNAGLLLGAKTTSPELGLTFTTESTLFGKTANPWNPERTSGGSSGGSAAAVAARILPAAHASDGGGSIRVPASCCGLFGLKPTRGRVPLGPAQFEGWNGLSVQHAITRSVRDSAALLDAAAGSEVGSPFLSPRPERPYLEETRLSPGALRIALAIDPTDGLPLDDECRTAVLNAARFCEQLGHQVDERRLPIDFDRLRAAFVTIVNVSVARALADGASALGRPPTAQDVESMTWVMAERGKQVSALEYAGAIAATHQIGLQMAIFQREYDIILSPTLAKPPVPLGVLSLSATDPRTFGRAVREFSPYTSVANVTGQPSMSVPLHWSPDGLPVGVMFSGRFGEDATLFRLAAQLEEASPWADRFPTGF